MSRQAFYPHLSVDCVLIGFDEEGLKVLLVEKTQFEPGHYPAGTPEKRHRPCAVWRRLCTYSLEKNGSGTRMVDIRTVLFPRLRYHPPDAFKQKFNFVLLLTR